VRGDHARDRSARRCVAGPVPFARDASTCNSHGL
jgi:hypothetical protein